MKRKKVLAVGLACLAIGPTMASCGGSGDKIINEQNVLNVKIYEGGYGTEYIYALKDAFETTFAKENYKINVLTPSSDVCFANIYQEIYMDGGVDIYFGGAVAEDGVYGEFGKCFADITESVLEKPAIGYDGKEEEGTIKDKIVYDYDRTIKGHDGEYYGLPHAMPLSGLAVNKKILSEMKLELPVTTNDFWNVSDAIMAESAAQITAGKKTYRTAVKPFTYALTGNNYIMGAAQTWMAQYGGDEEHAAFWAFSDEEGKPLSTDGTMATNPSIELAELFYEEKTSAVLENCFRMYDPNACVMNVATQSFIDAQTKLMQGKAVFCPTGDWFFNEMYKKNPEALNDIVFIKVPILSELGVMTFGAGTTYNLSEEDCEKVLKQIAQGADAGQTIAEIQQSVKENCGVTVSEADALKIAEARGYVRITTGDGIYVSEKSDKKDIAALFLRMCASKDGGLTFSEYARSTSPYNIGKIAENYEWTRSVNAIVNNPYLTQIATEAVGYREEIGVKDMFYQKDYLALYISEYKYNGELVSVFDLQSLQTKKDKSLYELASKQLAKEIYEDAKMRIMNKQWKLQ